MPATPGFWDTAMARVDRFFCEGLFMIGGNFSMEQLLPIVLKVGEINLKCMALLIKPIQKPTAHQFPQSAAESRKGPFIVVTGHDLRDLKLLLEQTKDSGINIYTHGEMLPAHAYPELKNIRSSRAILVLPGRTSRKSSTAFPHRSSIPQTA